MDMYDLGCLIVASALLVWFLALAASNSIVLNVSQAQHDAAVAERRLDAILAHESDVGNITELPFMRSVRTRSVWPALDSYELEAQFILAEASAEVMVVSWEELHA